jgi:hypothetical protein
MVKIHEIGSAASRRRARAGPILSQVCGVVRVQDVYPATKFIKGLKWDLQRTLDDFRETNGFGRAISAPQIG